MENARPKMEMFVVYFNPSDFPNKWVVRRAHIGSMIIEMDVEPLIVCEDLFAARAAVRKEGFEFVLPRQPGDDPVIYEVWL